MCIRDSIYSHTHYTVLVHTRTPTQPHCRYCDLVTIECYNDCGHCCQRKHLSSHLTSCPNKPEKCPRCSVHFTCNRLSEHEPHCCGISVPDSILSNIYKVHCTCACIYDCFRAYLSISEAMSCSSLSATCRTLGTCNSHLLYNVHVHACVHCNIHHMYTS